MKKHNEELGAPAIIALIIAFFIFIFSKIYR